jgi:hypothetical protein
MGDEHHLPINRSHLTWFCSCRWWLKRNQPVRGNMDRDPAAHACLVVMVGSGREAEFPGGRQRPISRNVGEGFDPPISLRAGN